MKTRLQPSLVAFILQKRSVHHSSSVVPLATDNINGHEFGFLFDIDGVFLRGRKVLPQAREAFRYLLDRREKWRVPTVFVTNAGNTLKQHKAEDLSSKFSVKIHPHQVVMSHSPLSMFHHFHDKHVLVCGQGPVNAIAYNLGFRNVTTIEEFSAHYPQLDVCDHNRRRAPPCAFEQYNRRIEAVVLFGEPVHWERSLQLVIDVLLTNGQPYANHRTLDKSLMAAHLRRPASLRHLHTKSASTSLSFSSNNSIESVSGDAFVPSMIPYPHLPVLACNMDLTWMAEAPLPRLGHGCFLVCLETLYEKLSGHRLLYTALVGKPSEVTYHHAECQLQQMAYEMRSLYSPQQMPVRRVYCIGDNPQTDIYGANLYQRYLQSQKMHRLQLSSKSEAQNQRVQRSPTPAEELAEVTSKYENTKQDSQQNPLAASDTCDARPEPTLGWGGGLAEECTSVLVCTGVYQRKNLPNVGSLKDESSKQLIIEAVRKQLLSETTSVNHQHRDFPPYPEMTVPHLVTDDVAHAVQEVMRRENFPLSAVS